RRSAEPLAARMRPRSLDEVVGQQHLLAPGAAFGEMVRAGRPVSMILWGPPGTGKTTLAWVVATETSAAFEALSASTAGVKEVREVLAGAGQRLEDRGQRTVLFLDEIHRFSKSQQDALLPGVEHGTVILIGATTENPFFEVNSPLISRSTLFRLEPLAPEDVARLLDRAVADEERGVGDTVSGMEDEARGVLAERAGGDARLALNALEVAALLAAGRGRRVISTADVEEALQRRVVRYDKAGDQHHDVISAFIKSLRGSDPDAAVYWLETMLTAGEDPEFIARRMVILASEDVGLADPAATATPTTTRAAWCPSSTYPMPRWGRCSTARAGRGRRPPWPSGWRRWTGRWGVPRGSEYPSARAGHHANFRQCPARRRRDPSRLPRVLPGPGAHGRPQRLSDPGGPDAAPD
ncbi:MAG: replication-associated recombination protein RarA, partial [Acidobacteria bacterium]|nr:replication-associated recombination protein RarA [Acidobacteriota bacterium]